MTVAITDKAAFPKHENNTACMEALDEFMMQLAGAGTLAMRKILSLTVLLVMSQSSCILVGGYSSDGGWFIWPGSVVSILVILVVAFLFLRRRS